MSAAAEEPPVRALLQRVGRSYFPLAFIARLPFAMTVIGLLTLVVSARGSVQLGGLNSAMAGLGVACIGPLLGAAADRFGQRPVLLCAGTANGLLLAAFAWIAFSPLPDGVMLLCAFLIGATSPQISPMSRSRLVTIIAHDLPVLQRPRLLNGVLAYESAIEEVVFVFGPVIVGLLATTLGAWAPVVGASALTLIFVVSFALHPTSRPPRTPAERAATLAPASELFRPALLVTVLGIVGVGFFFGSSFTSLTAFMQDRGDPESAGLLYGAMGVGSAILALSVAWMPQRFSLRARWIAFSAVILLGCVVLQLIDDVGGMVLSLALMGFGVGPTLVNLYSLGADRSPAGRSATVMTMLGSGIMVGQSSAAWITGAVADHAGTATALALPLVAAVIVMLAGVANWWLTPPAGDR
ncbi:MFS transporter [Leucobacter soli]|uniref:Major facilitator superfamily (MFS) profile domain-containing protein n=1 Tax=Leucobacter soli TaxID=2812850 RepID=A0A916NHP1_9MICO|nr:MFS transporter [Leucobacter soli]CAG7611345.1 hypothetical protein LEUCIP111803_01422 [Leucobacter soli]